MSRAAWTRKHTVAAVTAAVVVAGGGIGTAVALRPDPAPASAPPAASPTPAPSRAAASPTPKPTPAPPEPEPTDPLTGGRPSDQEVLAVKIENIAAARPQAGVADADIVFVEEVEASLTRLVAVYHSRFPRRVGPVRSARNTDVELLPLFGKPGLVYSGANRKVQRNLDRSPVKTLQRSTRDPRRVAPHNVFVDLAGVARSATVGRARSIGWTFAATDPRWSAADRESTPAGRVGGDRMRFDRSGDRYLVRWNGRTYDGGGRAARTDNVVVLQVANRADGNADVNGVRSVKSSTVGKGKVTVYRDGRVRSGTWRRPAAGKPMTLRDRDDQPISLRPGRTWVLLSG